MRHRFVRASLLEWRNNDGYSKSPSMQLSTVDSVAARQSRIPVSPGMFFLRWTRFLVAAGRVSGVCPSVRNGALCFVAGTTSIQHLYALCYAKSIPIDAPECTQSMLGSIPNRCAKDRNCARSFASLPFLRTLDFLPASHFAALSAPHVYTDLGPVGPR